MEIKYMSKFSTFLQVITLAIVVILCFLVGEVDATLKSLVSDGSQLPVDGPVPGSNDRRTAPARPTAPVASSTSADSPEGSLEVIQLKAMKELETQLADIKKRSIEDAAREIARVDEWQFIGSDEANARSRIDKEVGELRTRIESEVDALTASATQAANGKSAAEKMTRVKSLIVLYPTPSVDTQRAKLEQLATRVLLASRRIEEIKRLRYNEWAIEQIQGGLKGYRSETKVRGIADAKKLIKTDTDALIKIAIDWLKPIDPSYLEPVTMDLYSHVFNLTRDKLGSDDDSRIRLTQGLARHETIRKSPEDF